MKNLDQIMSDITVSDDGYYVYWPRNSGKGWLTSQILKTIAAELDRRNAAWNKEISEYFEKERNEETGH
jgi:hypothetical protein